MPLAGVLYLITLALAFRSISGSLLPLFAVGQGLIWTFGVIAFSRQPLNIVSNILPCMLLINGVSNSIHVLTRYSEEAVVRASPAATPAADTIRQMLVACLGAFSDGGHRFYVLEHGQLARAAGVRNAGGDGLVVPVLHGDSDARLAAALLPSRPRFRKSAFGNGFSLGLAHIGRAIVEWRWTTIGGFLLIAGRVALAGADRRDQFVDARDLRRKQSDHSDTARARGASLGTAAAGDQPAGGRARPVLSAGHFSQGGRTAAIRPSAEAGPLRAVVHRLLQRDQQPLRAGRKAVGRVAPHGRRGRSPHRAGLATFSAKWPTRCAITNSCRPTKRTRDCC